MNNAKNWIKELDLLNKIIKKMGLKHSIKCGIDVYVHEGHNVIGLCGLKII